jgi:hypothetical protein
VQQVSALRAPPQQVPAQEPQVSVVLPWAPTLPVRQLDASAPLWPPHPWLPSLP